MRTIMTLAVLAAGFLGFTTPGHYVLNALGVAEADGCSAVLLSGNEDDYRVRGRGNPRRLMSLACGSVQNASDSQKSPMRTLVACIAPISLA